MYGLPKSVCVVPAIPMSVKVLLPYVLFVFLYVGNYLLIYEFESWITGVGSHHVISLCDFAYYVSGKSLQLLCILSYGMVCLSAISMMFGKILLAECMLVGIMI